ncbi:DUF5658 family protein [Sporosarcina oncorhynchi]|uniref:DUF5658 family protein n=1 Tax=Sporosarcina oncorhynchi TaxID=3056444 RepID=UPI003D66B52A
MVHSCFLLVCLCVIDTFFTDFGIRQGHIQEANPFMSLIYNWSIIGFYAFKILLPTSLLIMVYFMKPSTVIRQMTIFSLILYLFVLSLHIYWVVIIAAFR